MKGLIYLITIIVVIIIGAFLIFGRESWIGFYYPNQYDLTRNTQSSELGSLEECRLWVEGQVDTYNPSGSGYDYECGKNCKAPDHPGGLYLCDETVDY